jgi:hypothetical protein
MYTNINCNFFCHYTHQTRTFHYQAKLFYARNGAKSPGNINTKMGMVWCLSFLVVPEFLVQTNDSMQLLTYQIYVNKSM